MDLRRIACRENIAALSLQGKIEAETYREGTVYEVAEPLVPLCRNPETAGPMETQVLQGERVRIFGQKGEWMWGQLESDSYVGYLPAAALKPPEARAQPTHKIMVPATHLYPEPDIKVPPLGDIFLTALVTGEDFVEGRGTECKFLRLGNGTFIIDRHVSATDYFARDFARVAQSFTGVPYLWGGKTVRGIDCSGLVQVSLHAAGHLQAPRDADMQMDELGEPVPFDDLEGLQKGDLIFWNGHVGIMVDESHILHANAYHMQVVQEPVWQTAARISRKGQDIIGVRRLSL